MASSTFRWVRRPSVAWNTRLYRDMLIRAVYRLLSYYAPQIETDAKTNAPWTDRTGNARQTLAAFVYIPEEAVIVLVLKQHMSYGVCLELKRGGRYAIVMPTLQLHYGPVWRAVTDVVA
jgi:hypothetical protein